MSTPSASDFLRGLPPSALSAITTQSNLQAASWQTIAQSIIAAMPREQLDQLPPGIFSPVIPELDNLGLPELDRVIRKVSEEPWVQEQYPDFWKDYLKATADPNDHGDVVSGTGSGTAPIFGPVGGPGDEPVDELAVGPGSAALRQCVYVICIEGHLDRVIIPTGFTNMVSGRVNKGERFPSEPYYGPFGNPIVDCPSDARWQAVTDRFCS